MLGNWTWSWLLELSILIPQGAKAARSCQEPSQPVLLGSEEAQAHTQTSTSLPEHGREASICGEEPTGENSPVIPWAQCRAAVEPPASGVLPGERALPGGDRGHARAPPRPAPTFPLTPAGSGRTLPLGSLTQQSKPFAAARATSLVTGGHPRAHAGHQAGVQGSILRLFSEGTAFLFPTQLTSQSPILKDWICHEHRQEGFVEPAVEQRLESEAGYPSGSFGWFA